MLDFTQRSIPQAAGVPYEILVQDISDQLSGVQEFERCRAGMNSLADDFDSMRLYQIRQAELTFAFLRAFHAGQLIRIVAEDQQLRAGYPERRGQRGRSCEYDPPYRRRAEQAEAARKCMTQG